MTAPEVPGATASIGNLRITELGHVTHDILTKVFQGEPNKLNLAAHIARVALNSHANYWENIIIPRCACDTSRGMAHREDCDLKQAQG